MVPSKISASESGMCSSRPAVQPNVQAFLARKLARFVTNLFKIRKRDVRCGRQQSAQSGERAACFRSVGEALPRCFGRSETDAFAHIKTGESARFLPHSTK